MGEPHNAQNKDGAINLPPGTRIVIIEGVAGSGKSTLHTQLKKMLRGKRVYDFSEEELLFSLKHVWIPGIATLRLEFFQKLLDYYEQKLRENADMIVILERFHLSLAALAWAVNHELPDDYDTLIRRLQGLPVHVFIPILGTEEIEQRAAHGERTDPHWSTHLQKRLQARNYASLQEMYAAEQQLVLQLAATQGIPYTTVQIAREQ